MLVGGEYHHQLVGEQHGAYTADVGDPGARVHEGIIKTPPEKVCEPRKETDGVTEKFVPGELGDVSCVVLVVPTGFDHRQTGYLGFQQVAIKVHVGKGLTRALAVADKIV